jgi:hypothetical protein
MSSYNFLSSSETALPSLLSVGIAPGILNFEYQGEEDEELLAVLLLEEASLAIAAVTSLLNLVDIAFTLSSIKD